MGVGQSSDLMLSVQHYSIAVQARLINGATHMRKGSVIIRIGPLFTLTEAMPIHMLHTPNIDLNMIFFSTFVHLISANSYE